MELAAGAFSRDSWRKELHVYSGTPIPWDSRDEEHSVLLEEEEEEEEDEEAAAPVSGFIP